MCSQYSLNLKALMKYTNTPQQPCFNCYSADQRLFWSNKYFQRKTKELWTLNEKAQTFAYLFSWSPKVSVNVAESSKPPWQLNWLPKANNPFPIQKRRRNILPIFNVFVHSNLHNFTLEPEVVKIKIGKYLAHNRIPWFFARLNS